MKFEVRNRGNAQDFSCDAPWACVSISTHVGDWPKINVDNRVAVIRVAFADVSDPDASLEDMPEEAIFNHEMAKVLLNFYDLMNQKNVEVMMIHCDAGISRSAGVAAAFSKIYEGDDSVFFNQRGPYIPNILVYRRILEAFYDSKDTVKTPTVNE